MKRKKILFLAIGITTITLSITFLAGCLKNDTIKYLPKKVLENEELNMLFTTLTNEDNSDEIQFGIVEQIIRRMRKMEQLRYLNVFLSNYTYNRPNDSFLAYYYMTIALNYMDLNEPEFAKIYFRRVVNDTQDMRIEEQSIHYLCLQEFIKLSTSPQEKIDSYLKLLNNYSDLIDRGFCYYHIGKIYEETGKAAEAISYFEKFINSEKTEVPGGDKTYEEILRKLGYYYNDVYWAFDTLDELIYAIRYSISKAPSLMEDYKAKDFFIMSWSQETASKYNHSRMPMASLITGRTKMAVQVESFSNDKEAYIRTSGWAMEYQVGVFYFYFRKINIPEKPSIHGKWEWAGVYLGERR